MTTKKAIAAPQQGGKGKGKQIDDFKEASYREPIDTSDTKVKFPGAIKKNKHVLAVMRDNKTWCLAKILEIRKTLPPEDESVIS
jgi:hypothetical protein